MESAGDEFDRRRREQSIDSIESPITRIVCTAFRDYGAYLVDGAGGFAFYAEHRDTAVVAESSVLALTRTDAIRASETNWEFAINEMKTSVGDCFTQVTATADYPSDSCSNPVISPTSNRTSRW
jgi:hypothetical protein